MKKLINHLSSPELTFILLLFFAIAIGSATFIEEKFDTVAAQQLIYNSTWLVLIYILLIINFLGNISRFNLLSWEKSSRLVFHLAFIVIIFGAGITRYFGYEGIMHIREGNTSNVIYSDEPYFQVKANIDGKEEIINKKLELSEYLNNTFHYELETKDTPVTIDYVDYIDNAEESILENSPDGTDMINLTVAGNSNRENYLLKENELITVGKNKISFAIETDTSSIRIVKKEGKLFLESPFPIVKMSHNMQMDSSLASNESKSVEFNEKVIYTTNNLVLLMSNYFKKAIVTYVRGNNGKTGNEAIVVNVKYKENEKQVTLLKSMSSEQKTTNIDFGNISLILGFGNAEMQLPFYLHLNDFKLERYHGSMSPSSYESDVTLINKKNNINENHRIYMNNVLDYKGFRFFQSSYDNDERGTVLSVNHDFWGTWISYIGYILLALGFLLTFFNKKSRFRSINNNIKNIRTVRKTGFVIILMILASFSSFSQNNIQKPVQREQADKFGRLVVQTFDGRFEPVHTLAVDIMHKISRKDYFNTQEKGKIEPVQFLIDILLDPEYWKQQKIIYIREKSVENVIGVSDNYASFNDFLDKNSNYKLAEYAEKAFQKKASEQNAFDKEIIKVDERINVFMTALNGEMLKIIPSPVPTSTKWLNVNDSLAYRPLTPEQKEMVASLKLTEINYSNLIRYYIFTIMEAQKTGDYTTSNKVLNIINDIQRNETTQSYLPSESRINNEVTYNELNIFEKLKKVYSILCVFLLVLAFAESLISKPNKYINIALWIFIACLGIAFIFHTFGLIFRWYLSGHAPWSNGYEALLLIAWAGLLAGFSFIRNSKITLASTALLAFLTLMTAGHSSYDPQLTNLQPVLKSYWLIIHVAVITLSYGFLALGFLLGLINLFIYLFKNEKNAIKISLVTKELTCNNEMSLSIGIALATIGTFLGGVWANESWGRYWGWDAKETWALVIIIVYAIILHLRFIPKMKSQFIFNVASIIGFGSVLMTFFGVNYYLSKGLHSYAANEKTVFPIWAWIIIFSLIIVIIFSEIKLSRLNKKLKNK